MLIKTADEKAQPLSELPHAPVTDSLNTAQHAELWTLIATSRQCLVGAVMAELTCLNWEVGQRMRRIAKSFPLEEIVAMLSRRLTRCSSSTTLSETT